MLKHHPKKPPQKKQKTQKYIRKYIINLIQKIKKKIEILQNNKKIYIYHIIYQQNQTITLVYSA